VRNRPVLIASVLVVALLALAATTQINWLTQVANGPVFDIRTYNVGATTTCGLQEAINAANTAGGGTIQIPVNFSCTATAGASTGASNPHIAIISSAPVGSTQIMLSGTGITWLTVGSGGIVIDGVAVNGVSYANSDTGISVVGSVSGTTGTINSGTIIRNSTFQNLAIGLNLANVTAVTVQNNLMAWAQTGIQTGDQVNGDQGLGDISGNTIECYGIPSCGVGMLLEGPGGAQVHDNFIGGYTYDILLQLDMGTVNTSGTAVTRASGDSFLSAWAGGQMSIGGTLYTISTVNSATSITLSASAGTQTGAIFYVPFSTSEFEIVHNQIDNGTATGLAAGIQLQGPVMVAAVLIEDNLINEWGTNNNWQAIVLNNANASNLVISNNQASIAGGTNTSCVYAVGGTKMIVSGGSCTGFVNGIVNNGSAGLSVGDLQYNSVGAPLGITNPSSWFINTIAPVSYSALSTWTPANGSRVYCSDCNATCTAGSSSGRSCVRENGAWTH